jgi:hypothetical protein
MTDKTMSAEDYDFIRRRICDLNLASSEADELGASHRDGRTALWRLPLGDGFPGPQTDPDAASQPPPAPGGSNEPNEQ